MAVKIKMADTSLVSRVKTTAGTRRNNSKKHSKNSNHLQSHLRAIMALGHRRLIRPGKKNQAEFFALDKFTLQNLANKSGCV